MSDETRYTVAGYPLADCPLEFLQREAVAGNALRAGGYTSTDDWAKLHAVEAEIIRRTPPPIPDPRDAVVAAARAYINELDNGIFLDRESEARDALRAALKGLG